MVIPDRSAGACRHPAHPSPRGHVDDLGRPRVLLAQGLRLYRGAPHGDFCSCVIASGLALGSRNGDEVCGGHGSGCRRTVRRDPVGP